MNTGIADQVSQAIGLMQSVQGCRARRACLMVPSLRHYRLSDTQAI